MVPAVAAVVLGDTFTVFLVGTATWLENADCSHLVVVILLRHPLCGGGRGIRVDFD